MIPRLTDELDFHSQALALRAERQRLIAGNIANADTPGFKARDFDFAAALRAATAASPGAGGGSSGGIAQDVARNVASFGGGVGDDGSPSPALQYALPAQTNLDSNSVDMDRERAASAENSVLYEASLRFITDHVKTTLDAMKSYHQS